MSGEAKRAPLGPGFYEAMAPYGHNANTQSWRCSQRVSKLPWLPGQPEFASNDDQKEGL